MGRAPWLGMEQMEGENGVETWFRSRNQIWHFGPLTYIHRFACQIMGLEFEYGLRKVLDIQDHSAYGLASIMCL